MPPEKPKKRLVSKGRYALDLAGGFGIVLTGGVLMVIGFIGAAICCISFIAAARYASPYALFPLCYGMFSALVAYGGYTLINTVDAMEKLEPITRHNVAQLPAEESLVRPSSADSIPQEQSLLRATTATDETPSIELLRPQSIESAESTLESGRPA